MSFTAVGFRESSPTRIYQVLPLRARQGTTLVSDTLDRIGDPSPIPGPITWRFAKAALLSGGGS